MKEWIENNKDILLLLCNLLVFALTWCLSYFRNWRYDVQNKHGSQYDLAVSLLNERFKSELTSMAQLHNQLPDVDELAADSRYAAHLKTASKAKDRLAKIKFCFRWLGHTLAAANYLSWIVVAFLLVCVLILALSPGSHWMTVSWIGFAISFIVLLFATAIANLLDSRFMADIRKTRIDSDKTTRVQDV